MSPPPPPSHCPGQCPSPPTERGENSKTHTKCIVGVSGAYFSHQSKARSPIIPSGMCTWSTDFWAATQKAIAAAASVLYSIGGGEANKQLKLPNIHQNRIQLLAEKRMSDPTLSNKLDEREGYRRTNPLAISTSQRFSLAKICSAAHSFFCPETITYLRTQLNVHTHLSERMNGRRVLHFGVHTCVCTVHTLDPP